MLHNPIIKKKSFLKSLHFSIISYLAIAEKSASERSTNDLIDWLKIQIPRTNDSTAHTIAESGISPSLNSYKKTLNALGVDLEIYFEEKIEETWISLKNKDIIRVDPTCLSTKFQDKLFTLTPLCLKLLSSWPGIDSYLKNKSAIANVWKNSVVRLTFRNKTGIGTGFFIEENLIVTAAHVVDSTDLSSLEIHDMLSNKFIPKKIILHSNKEHIDLALIEINYCKEIHYFKLGGSADYLDEVTSFGFPPIPTNFKNDIIITSGQVNGLVNSSFLKSSLNKHPTILFSSIIKPGNSGGPLIDNDGRLVGVITETLEDGEGSGIAKQLGYSAAISADHLMDFLIQENLVPSDIKHHF